MTDWQSINLANWDERAPAHAASPDYALHRFRDDPDYISEVVAFDRPRLGDLTGLIGVHLQCHIGTDTVSLARLGARMTGLDFAPNAVAEAQRLADAIGADARFVRSDVYAAVDVLGAESFDFVFTGIGALCWLPDVDRWASVVATLLRPGGRLFIREGHPVLWSLQEGRDDDLIVIEFPYFERAEPLVWEEQGTYVATEASFTNNLTHQWNHGLGEIVTAVLAHGLQLQVLVEHDTVPWDALPGQMEQVSGPGWVEWRLRDRPWRVPHSYTLHAVKPATLAG